MNKYTELSDFEINLLVAQFVLPETQYDVIKQTMDIIQFLVDGSFGYRFFDPCNNPTDAIPIIIENKISLLAGDGNFWCARYGEWNILPCPSGIEFIEKAQVINDSPYRAAMELFLMMKDTENEKIRPYL
ncbi:phage protein NinX family protein [Proteus genomosp. 6]|uniref:phage protein NinX family protein n=1 Tax=Proteus genomosp. 6 TaxID=1311820 RepID=UPI000D69D0A1|nr:phage protein NinX family protein [Proteus genomosp. 6]